MPHYIPLPGSVYFFTITAPTFLRQQVERVFAISAICIKYSSQLGRTFFSPFISFGSADLPTKSVFDEKRIDFAPYSLFFYPFSLSLYINPHMNPYTYSKGYQIAISSDGFFSKPLIFILCQTIDHRHLPIPERYRHFHLIFSSTAAT